MSTTHEQNLIEKCRSGNTSAFGPLMQIYRRQLFSYLFKLSGERTQAEDLLQETLIKTWKGIKKYSERQKFSSWLFTIAHNTAMDNLRKRNNDYLISDVEPDELQSANDPHKEFIKNETNTLIEKAIVTLSTKQKEVFLLRLYGEMSFKEISELTKEPLNTVLSHMHYSVKKIKKLLGNDNEQ
ncbi:MAG: RNA polymerase sigma factor [Ignavibacteriales bacterium]|nr:RNA polymerase sigma factor [Ignavibacteriales bacterium]